MIDKKSGLPLAAYNDQQLIITIDGVFQEPGKAFTVIGSQIIFDSPPFGDNIVDGQEVKGQKFYGRYFKFKKDELNLRYLKKLKSLEKQFDGEETQFNLYYEDGSIVKTDPNENLIVTLNAIVQKAAYFDSISNSPEPIKNSYYILRSDDETEPDKIVFSSPPIKHNDIVENTEADIAGYEKSFAYTIGSYLRLKINTDTIPFRRTGPFLIIDEVKERVKKIDDSKYVLVFIDGVLQIEKQSYNISGPTITFTKPLNYFISESGDITYPDVNIILLYGRDIAQSLTVYDFEPDTFYNKLTLNIKGQNTYSQFFAWYSPVGTREILVYQDNVVLGKLRRFAKISETEWEVVLSSQNVVYNQNLPLKFTAIDTYNKTYNNYADLTITGEVSSSYEQDADGNRTLVRASSRYLYASELADKAWYEQTRSYANLQPGDLIKIDGENDYREIIQIPHTAKTKDYRSNSFISNDIYSRIIATNYSDIVRGEGLSIIAKISSGKVVSLDWNRRELNLYFENNLLLQPTAYQYYTPPIIQFIPNDKTGGGAKAQVIVYDGQVIDLLLLDGGSNYQEAPTVTVARGYDIVKDPNRKIDSITKLNLDIEILNSSLQISYFLDIRSSRLDDISTEIISLGGPVETTFYRKLSAIIQSINNVTFVDAPTSSEIFIFGGFEREVELSSIVSVNKQITTIINVPFDVVSNSSIVSTNREITTKFTKLINNTIIETAPESVNDIGAFLDAPLSETDNIVYIADTRRFPDASRLLIGKEIVTYDSKLSDRFLNVIRGAFGTTATTHEAGDYLRHLPELVSIIPVGPTTSIISEVTLIETYSTSTSLVRVFSPLAEDVVQVSIEEDAVTEVIAQRQSNIDTIIEKSDREILISLPVIYFDVLNSYSSTYVSFSAGGVFDVITQTSSIVSTIQSTDIQITNTVGIDIDNSDTIISSQTIVSAESSFESTSSTIVTLVFSDSKLTSALQIEALTTFNSYSTTIVVGADINISSISSAFNSIEFIGQEIVIFVPPTGLTVLNSYSSTFVSYTVGGVFDVITQTSSIVSAIESTDIQITSTFDIDIDYTDVQFEQEIVIFVPPSGATVLNSYSSTFVSIGYASIESIISSSTSTLQSVDTQITNIFDINVDNSNTIISTQLVASAESSFESTSSTIVTLVFGDSKLTSALQIEALSTFNAYSTTINVGADINISSISSAFNSIDSIRQEIVIIPPTTYVTSLNSYSSTFVSIGYATVEAITSSSVSTIESVDTEITYTFDINVDNSNTIISTQLVASAESSFESTSSTIVTSVYNDTFVTNILQIEESSTINAYSTVITVGSQSGISTISALKPSVETLSREIIVGSVFNNIAAINAFSSALSTVIAGVDNPIVASSSLLTTIESVNNQITTTFTIVEKHSNLITSSQITADIGQGLEIISSTPISSDYVTTILTITANITTIAANKLAKNADVERFYKTGIIDYLIESILLIQFIPTRTELITLESPINEIYQRSGEIINVTNKSSFEDASVESYTPANSGFTLKTFENNIFINTGSYGVNGSIESLTLAYPTLTFRDFEERPNSAITRSGQTFNFGIPTINSSGAFISDDIDDNQTFIMVQSTTGFPSSGKLLLGKEIIYYTEKTATSFIGVLRGIDNTIPDEHLSGDYLRTFD